MENNESQKPQHQVEFSTDTFEINFLSDSPEGFKVRTRNSLMRHAPNTPLRFAKDIAKERAREKKDNRVGPNFAPKVGIRNPHLENGELVVDTMPVTFPTYKAISAPEITPDQKEISNPTGTALILLTTESDGSHKLILQHRSPKNFFYGDIPGASVAGYFDGQLQGATLKPIDTNSVKNNGTKEMWEEVGISPTDIADLKITGLASDKVRVHNEFLLMATTKLSAEDTLFRAGAGDHFKFIEQTITIDATIASIGKLLTQVKCPLPPTHVAAFVATGYSMVLEQQGKDAANAWKKTMEAEVNRNYREINQMVANYYDEIPGELQNVPDGKPQRNPKGYEPGYTPSQQGLPDMESELERLGLATKELETNVDDVYIFDVDGVLTDPNEKLFDREVMEAIAKRLNNKQPVILNTGRSVSWVQSVIIARLHFAHNVVDKKAWQNLFIIGEKGGTWLGFNEDGYMPPVPSRDGSIAIPEEIQKLVKDLVKDEFSDTMFYDPTKWTMVSVEQRDGFTEQEHNEKFVPAQIQLAERVRELIDETGLGKDFRVDATTIATDIENKIVGKDFAVQRAVAWLKQRRIIPNKYVTFGDSKSDFAMAERLQELGVNVEHVHVGNPNNIPENAEYPVITTSGKFNAGTREFLQGR
jgi:hydroxymethylpyrimidine pyrophosphatase-like HAD family hydrolase